MLIWQGWGILAVLLPVGSYMLVVKLLQGMLGVAYTNTHSWPGALGTLLGAGAVWLIALKVNRPGRTLVDPATGQKLVLRRRNTIMFLPMEYAAIALAVVALGMLVLKSNSPL